VDALGAIRSDPRIATLVGLLEHRQAPAAAAGLWGSLAPILGGAAAETAGRPLLWVTAHADDADSAVDDLETYLGFTPELLPQLDTALAGAPEDEELAGERLRLCLKLTRERFDAPPIIVAPLLALMQPVPAAEAIAARSRELAVGMTLDPEALVEWLTAGGFQRCDQVEIPGDFAQRGGIVDVFSNAHTDPIRVEFFGDQIESLRYFDAGTQRSATPIDAVQVPALSVAAQTQQPGHATSDQTTSFLALLPADTIIALHEPGEIQELGRTYWQRLGERAGIIPVDALFRRANDFAQLHLQRFTAETERTVDFAAGSLPQFEPRRAEALAALQELTGSKSVQVFCENAAEAQRFGELLAEHDPPITGVSIAIGVLHRGFTLGQQAYVPHHEIFAHARQRRSLRRVQPARPIDTFLDLKPGDYVVHVLHGIGRFQGLKSMERSGQRDEFLAVEFADSAVLHVPVSQIHVVQKYIGGFRGRPKLSKLGAAAWKKTKQRVAEAVTDLAAELLAIQAQRANETGQAYPADTPWQREFEEAFPYTETEDQLRTLAEIKSDLQRPRAMDRLICGDVGYGKTELAIRAAFKVIEYGKQVAVLVPTTVLAEQHHETFRERFADFPFTVEVINRFRSAKEQAQIAERARKGQIDVLIGTHRLLSKDIRFADLGLVIIDEEQRFGVEAKESLKRLRATVEVLTLSATPIPRTLHLSMLGIRDISSLATPPVDRRSIVTQVRNWDDQLVREAILRELNRDGQVYFVHNFVRDIETVANRIRTLVPEARVVVGHGQMKGSELEQVMLQFMHHEADVLVSTNIIESGLDIPSANTMFIHRPERFGLADLHQLRGRVGRSRQRAYCYLMLSPKHPVQDVAARRLKAIEHYSDLGAGFQIAMRDLELRGAGNILGPEQSGHIEAVGYEMYCQLLENAVRKLKNEPERRFKPVNLDLGIEATIPRSYIRAERQRMDAYKRLSMAATVADIASLAEDLRDAFGPIPDEVQTLLTLAEIRVLAGQWGIRAIVRKEPDLIFSIDDLKQVDPLFADGPGSPRMPDPQTIHWRLMPRFFAPGTLLGLLRRQLAGEPAGAETETVA
jgi:transcription-repair coupling factor (superfamily II helicase)